MRDRSDAPRLTWRTALTWVTLLLFAPDKRLAFTWIVLTFLASVIFSPLVGNAVLMGGLTLVFALMLAVAAYMPPTRAFREVSTLAARVADLLRVASGAALFGAAAAYSGVVGSIMSRIPLEEAMFPAVVWGFIWPILLVATMLGASVVGVRLGWDFRRSNRRALLLALGKLRSRLPEHRMKRHPITNWLASIVISGSRSGAFMVVGYLAPAIIVGDIYFVIEYINAVG